MPRLRRGSGGARAGSGRGERKRLRGGSGRFSVLHGRALWRLQSPFAEVEDDLRHAVAASGRIGFELLELVEDDVRAYGLVSAAYGMERDNPHRSEVIQDALHEAALPPYRIMVACSRVLALLEEMADKSSRQLLSDVACGAVFCRAALQSASLTLFANTTSMKDRERAEELERECDALLDTWLPRADGLAKRAADAARKRS